MLRFVDSNKAMLRKIKPKHCYRRSLNVLLGLGLLLCLPVQAADLQGVRVHEAPDHTRVVLDLSGPMGHTLFTLDNPHRVIIDLPEATLGAGFNEATAAGHQRIRRLRAARRDGGYRLVLDVTAKMRPEAFALQPAAANGHRLVVDLYGAGSVTTAAPAPPPAAAPRPKLENPAPKPPAQTAKLPEPKRDVLIAIDPGHGGNDPGALGPGKIREKDVVLAISKQLVDGLKKQRGFDAVLIRTGDYYVNLRERVRQARAKRADLFVSVHADAFHSPQASGASVYTLSESGASNEAARWLAAKENQSDLIGGAGRVTLKDKDDLLVEVLINMSTNATRSLSRRAGAAVLSELGSFAKLHRKTVEKAGFMVLKAPDVPSILVETGYISNPAEARRLASAEYQRKIAKAIARGVTRHMEQSAPPGTWLAQQESHEPTEHTIRRGETLSGLALRYGIATRRIVEANALVGDRIRIGQTLIIPAG
ncbi:MAG: N-acetylmuramoyl-L-alanine amidase [Pseudomonadales bacterium]